MNNKIASIIILICLISLPIGQTADVPPVPTEPGTWVIDDANILNDVEWDELNRMCNKVHQETGRPIVVLTIESFEDQNASGWGEERYAQFAFDSYGINDVNMENKAILVLLSEQDRRFWIELGGGYAIQNLDDFVQGVYDREIKPELSEDNWYNGLEAAVIGMEPILYDHEVTWAEVFAKLWIFPVLFIYFSFNFAFKRSRLLTYLKDYVLKYSMASEDLRKFNQKLMQDFIWTNFSKIPEDISKELGNWNGMFSMLNDEKIKAFRKLDDLNFDEYVFDLEPYKEQIEIFADAKKAEDLYQNTGMSTFLSSCAIFAIPLIFANLSYDYFKQYSVDVLNLQFVLFCGFLLFISIFPGSIFHAITTERLVRNYTPPNGIQINLENANISKEVALISRLPQFSKQFKKANQTNFDSSIYTWKVGESFDDFENAFGKTHAERSSGGGGSSYSSSSSSFDSGGSSGGGGGGGGF